LAGLQPPYSTALSDFNGIDPKGVWKLYIVDDSNQERGVVSGGWSLGVTTAAAAAALPLLACERSASGAEIVLRWETTADVQLVSAPSLSSTTWSPVTEPVSAAVV
jgi:subtilisin-like proprotein convertase family protein